MQYTNNVRGTTFSPVGRCPIPGRIGFVVAVICGVAFSFAAEATTITVTTTADNAIAGDGECTLREAIGNADAGTDTTAGDCAAGDPEGDEIVFEPALAGGTITLNGSELPVISNPDGDLSIVGPLPGNPKGITIDADYGSRILNLDSPSGRIHIQLSGMTLTRGRASGPGGAILASHAGQKLTDVVLTENETTGDHAHGGAIGTNCCAASVTLVRTLVSNNHTQGNDSPGGGLFLSAGAELIDSSVTSNWTLGERSWGGGLVGGDLTLENSVVSDNHTEGADAGGGGLLSSYPKLRNSTIRDNYTLGTNAGGGGIHFLAVALVEKTAVFGNWTSGDGADGGGIRGSRLDDWWCIGGLCVSAGNISMVNSTISGNSTEGTGAAGGGLSVGIDDIDGSRIGGGHVTLKNTTIVGNSAASGAGGVHMRGETNELGAHNSIIAPVQGDACQRPIASGNNNLFADPSCDGSATSTSAIGLGPLTDNGGPTLTHLLTPGSAGLDAAGDCVAEFDISEDQRGMRRPQSHACDIGAVEGLTSMTIPTLRWPAGLALLLALAGLATAQRIEWNRGINDA